MKTLEEHNKEMGEINRNLMDNSPRKNGIACPKCGEELLDSTPNIVLMSNPSQYNIHCEKCGYAGYRF